MNQDGQAAVLALVCVLMGFMVLGLVLDLGLIAIQRSRLDHAADASARAVARACESVMVQAGGADCPADTATHYLQENLPDAHLEEVQVEETGRVSVQASLVVDHPFAALWNAPPVRLVAQASAKMG